jgi:hypothetical protein
MPEIEREEVIAQRLEELQRITDKRNLDQMWKAHKDGDGDSVAKAAKRTLPDNCILLQSRPYLQASMPSAAQPRKSHGSSTS